MAECFTSVFALEPSPVIAEKVEVRDKALFEAIDSLIQITDLKMTVKPEYRDKVRDTLESILIFRPDSTLSRLLGITKNSADDEFVLLAFANEDSEITGYYFFTTPHYRFVSMNYDATLYEKKLGTKECIGYETLSFSNGGLSWIFKIKDGRVLEAYYHYGEMLDPNEAVYDILNKKLVPGDSIDF